MVQYEESFDNLSVGDYVKVKEDLVLGNCYVYQDDYDEEKYVAIRYSHLTGHLAPGAVAKVTRVDKDGTCRAVPAFLSEAVGNEVWYSFAMLDIIGKDCDKTIKFEDKEDTDTKSYVNKKPIGDYSEGNHCFSFGEAMDYLIKNEEYGIKAFVKNVTTKEVVTIDKDGVLVAIDNSEPAGAIDFIPDAVDMKQHWIKHEPAKAKLIEASECIAEAMNLIASPKGNVKLQEILNTLALIIG